MKTITKIINEFIQFIKTNQLACEDVFLYITFNGTALCELQFETNNLNTLSIYGKNNCNIQTIMPALTVYLDDINECRDVPIATLIAATQTLIITNYKIEVE